MRERNISKLIRYMRDLAFFFFCGVTLQGAPAWWAVNGTRAVQKKQSTKIRDIATDQAL